jgi:hypothetical protein
MHKLLTINIPFKLFLGCVLILGLSSNTIAQGSASDVAATAASQTGGKVLQVKENKAGNYRVKVLMPNGQIRHIIIDNPNSSSKK